jgi:ferrochelatase
MASKAVVLVNLGTPAQATPSAIRQFLSLFLSDRRLVELPRLLWLIILYAFIVPFRPFKITPMYKRLWDTFGDSPLRIFSERLRKKLQLSLQEDALSSNGEACRVVQAYTYSQPRITEVLDQLYAQGCETILVLPLYPQFSITTTASIYDQVAAWLTRQRHMPTITVLRDYHQHPAYISAMAARIRQHWNQHGRHQRLLLSFHSIPQLCIDRGDPYQHQCEKTAELLIAELGLSDDEWGMSYQSRLGKGKWLQPYTSQLLQQWAKQGVSSVDVFCPAFVVDCIETIEEIDGENREVFLHFGGQKFAYIECLNDSDEHIDLFKKLLAEHL